MGTQTTFSVPEKTALVQFEVCPKIITRVAFFLKKLAGALLCHLRRRSNNT
jgi:hypothetical protein